MLLASSQSPAVQNCCRVSSDLLYSNHPYWPLHAAEGQPMTVVMTDVEGSTELWEWDHETMLQVSC